MKIPPINIGLALTVLGSIALLGSYFSTPSRFTADGVAGRDEMEQREAIREDNMILGGIIVLVGIALMTNERNR